MSLIPVCVALARQAINSAPDSCKITKNKSLICCFPAFQGDDIDAELFLPNTGCFLLGLGGSGSTWGLRGRTNGSVFPSQDLWELWKRPSWSEKFKSRFLDKVRKWISFNAYDRLIRKTSIGIVFRQLFLLRRNREKLPVLFSKTME